MKQQLLQKFEEEFDHELFTPENGEEILIDVKSEKIKNFLSEAISQTEKEVRENTIKEIERELEHIDITFDSERENKQAKLLKDLWEAKFYPAIKKAVQSLLKDKIV